MKSRDPRQDGDFCAAFAKALKRAFEDRKIKKAHAAAELGVTRQAIYDYLKGKYSPQKASIAEAFWLWDLELEYRGRTFRKQDFPRRKDQIARRPEQLTIADVLKTLKPEQITARIGAQRRDSLVLVVKLKFAG